MKNDPRTLQIPTDILESYPMPNDPFWLQFNQPLKAYYLVAGMSRYYFHSLAPPPSRPTDDDYYMIAWRIGQMVRSGMIDRPEFYGSDNWLQIGS